MKCREFIDVRNVLIILICEKEKIMEFKKQDTIVIDIHERFPILCGDCQFSTGCCYPICGYFNTELKEILYGNIRCDECFEFVGDTETLKHRAEIEKKIDQEYDERIKASETEQEMKEYQELIKEGKEAAEKLANLAAGGIEIPVAGFLK